MRSALPFLGTALVLASACRLPRSVPTPIASPDSARIRGDIAWLADDLREGRGTGTSGAERRTTMATLGRRGE